MRIIAIAALCTLVSAPLHAQQVNRIKASAANAAGACAGTFEMLGQYLCHAQTPDQRKLAAYQKARDFFSEMPEFPAADIERAAQAFVALMSKRIKAASNIDETHAIQRELLQVADQCVMTTGYTILLTEERVACLPVAGQPLQPQPLTTIPLETQPLVTQPYDTQPLVLDPIVPAQ